MLSFAGISPAHAQALAREQQFAEKIHAYTLPRGERTNTRVKDLIDLLLLLRIGLPDTAVVKQAIQATFERRATHPIPRTLDPPPEDWRASYADLAAECGLDQVVMADGFATIVAYWDRVFPAV